MRILEVTEADWIERGPHLDHHLMERLTQRGHEVIVIDFQIRWRVHEKRDFLSRREVHKGIHKTIDDGNVTVIRPSIVRLPILEYLSLIYTHRREIKKQIDDFKPDVIVGFGILSSNIAMKLANKWHIPFVYYIVDELHRFVPQKQFQSLAKYIEGENMRNADRVISMNESLREYTIRMGAIKNKTEVIRTGVDLERYNSDGRRLIRERYGIKDNEILLFFLGWLYEFSGLKEVASRMTKSEFHNIKLMTLGEGELLYTLQDIKKKCGLNNRIITVSWKPYDEVPKYLAASDICILPSHKNKIMQNIVPIKMYEYMAAGKPVIATALPGLIKEFGNNNGIIYVDRPEDTLEQVHHLIDHRSIEMNGLIARKFVEKQDWGAATDRFEELLYMSCGCRRI